MIDILGNRALNLAVLGEKRFVWWYCLRDNRMNVVENLTTNWATLIIRRNFLVNDDQFFAW